MGLGGFRGCWIKDSFRSSELDATYSLLPLQGTGVGPTVCRAGHMLNPISFAPPPHGHCCSHFSAGESRL